MAPLEEHEPAFIYLKDYLSGAKVPQVYLTATALCDSNDVEL